MIGFFYAFFWQVVNNLFNDNALRFFNFYGTYFGISDENIKISSK